MTRRFRMSAAAGLLGLTAGIWLASGCGNQPPSAPAARSEEPAPGEMDFCDFKQGPADAPVKVVAFYPGRHEDTLAAVKGLLDRFPGKVQVEVVDWRHKEGRTRRDDAGLTCAGIVINDRNAFDLTLDGKREKVMFVRGIDGDWTAPHLIAAVSQELEARSGNGGVSQPE